MFFLSPSLAFVRNQLAGQNQISSRYSTTRQLIPLAKFEESISFFSEPDSYRCCVDENGSFSTGDSNDGTSTFELALIEEDELPDLCKFVVTTFGAEAIQLSSDINSFERMLMSPAAEFLNGYSGMVAFAEVFSGTKQRIADRLQDNPELVQISAPDLKGLTYEEKIRKAAEMTKRWGSAGGHTVFLRDILPEKAAQKKKENTFQ